MSTGLVLDFGSAFSKVGFAGDDLPKSIFPTVVSRPLHQTIKLESEPLQYGMDNYIGSEVFSKRGINRIKYPLEHGVVTNWDDMELLLKHTFKNELKVAPEEHPILFTEIPLNPKANREKIIEIMMENFNVPAFYLSNQLVLSLYTSGRSTGVVLDSGYQVTHSVVVYEGFAVQHSTQRLDLGGRCITDYFAKIFTQYQLRTTGEIEIANDIKEKLCYVALDIDEEMKMKNEDFEKSYELPDGTFVTIGNERFRSPEILFNPSLIEMDSEGITEKIIKTIAKVDQDLVKYLYQHIIVAGGSTLLNGFEKRLEKEMKQLIPGNTKMKIVPVEEKKCSSWIGGSILASLQTFQKIWIELEDYDEMGPRIVHSKCY